MIQQLQLSELKRHAMTGVSYMLPLVVASGLLIAIGNICGNNPPVISDYKSPYTLWQAAVTLGVYGMGLIPAVMSAAISYSIADRPGIAPGLLMGMIANSMGAGFFGGMLGGYMAGWCVNFLKKVVKVPVWAQALMPMLILPLLASLIVGFIMFFLLGGPIAAASFALTDMLQNMQGGSKAIFGAIMGAMAAFDFGGPVNKVAFPLGICMITEGVIPIAAVDPLRVIFSCSTGAAVGGALIMLLGVESPVPSGGMFIVPAMQNPLGFLIALGVGSVITALLLVLLKKDATEETIVDDEEEEDIDLSNINIK